MLDSLLFRDPHFILPSELETNISPNLSFMQTHNNSIKRIPF